MRKIVLLLSFLSCFVNLALSQNYDIIIRGGNVIDPKNNIDAVMDIAISNGKIVLVAKNLDTTKALQVVDAKGLYVTPGLIDIHTHNFIGTVEGQAYMNSFSAVAPDGFTFRVGVTTVVDAGSSGWKTFPEFKKNVIDKSQTRVLAFLNIVGQGMRGSGYEQDTNDMDAKLTAMTARGNKKDVVGIKLAHYEGGEWLPADRAAEAGRIADIPVMIDFGGAKPPLPIEDLFTKHLRPGDIFTHCFAQLNTREALVDTATKKIKPFVIEAQKKGIIFDVGFGGISFSFSQAIPAIKSGFFPNSISTDLHIGSMNNAMKDQLSVMSKMLAIGMDLRMVITAATWNPAKEIKREELGNLSVGSDADVAILNLRDGKFGFFDYTGFKVTTNKKLECEMTIRGGKIVYDLNGIANPVFVKQVNKPPVLTTH